MISYQARRIKSKLCVAGDSSCETEYAASAAACKEINFLRGIMSVGFIPEGPIILAVDNDAAIRVANDVGVTKRNMHFERAAHYIRHALIHNRVLNSYGLILRCKWLTFIPRLWTLLLSLLTAIIIYVRDVLAQGHVPHVSPQIQA